MKPKKIVLITIIFILSISNFALAEQENFYEEKIDLDLRGVELEEAFRSLADIAGLNVVIGEDLSGNVRVNLKNMDFLQAVDMLTKPRGLDYRIKDNTIVIDSENNLRNFDERETKVFQLKNDNLEEVRENLQSTIQEDHYSDMNTSNISININENLEALVITGYNDELIRIEEILEEIDVEKEQVMLQVIVQDISRSKVKDLGINWSFGDMLVGQTEMVETEEGVEEVETGGFDFGMSNLDFDSMLDFLESKGDSNILANPQIATLDGEQASITIGDRVPIRRSASSEDDEVDFEEVGVMLDIEPKVLEDDKIRIKANPEVSSTTGYEGNLPIISTREVETTIRVEDGKTIAIGGLIENQEIEDETGIPFLKDIPYLGNVFTNNMTDEEERELMIFITPKIIDDSGSEIELKDEGKLKNANEILQRIEAGEKELYSNEEKLEEKEEKLLDKEESISQREEELLSQEEQIEKISEELDTEKENIKEIIEKFQDEGINIETTSTSMLKEMVEGEEFVEEKEKEEEKEELDEKRKDGVITRVISIFKF